MMSTERSALSSHCTGDDTDCFDRTEVPCWPVRSSPGATLSWTRWTVEDRLRLTAPSTLSLTVTDTARKPVHVLNWLSTALVLNIERKDYVLDILDHFSPYFCSSWWIFRKGQNGSYDLWLLILYNVKFIEHILTVREARPNSSAEHERMNTRVFFSRLFNSFWIPY